MNAREIAVSLSLIVALCAQAADDDGPLEDKTFVVWASPASAETRGGSCLTLERGDRFDALVFGESAPGIWSAGSEFWSRTARDAAAVAPETRYAGAPVKMAIVWAGRTVCIFRDDVLLAQYENAGEPPAFEGGTRALIGRRHTTAPATGSGFVGRVFEARIYRGALSEKVLATLKRGEEGAETPWARWNFAQGVDELTGRFSKSRLDGGAEVREGALVLPREGAGLSASLPERRPWNGEGPVPEYALAENRLLRERLAADRTRPLYHFAAPGVIAIPGDPNGAFWANGRYHLMYLYRRPNPQLDGCDYFCWGHMSSADLLHWRHHPDSIVPEKGDFGAFSGGAFVDDDGRAYLSYWMLWGALGIGLVESADSDYETWRRSKENPIVRSTSFGVSDLRGADGRGQLYASADPSNIWKKDGRYYMLTGNKPLLDAFGRDPAAPEELKGDRLDLFVSDDLKKWTYLHPFYARRTNETRATGWTDPDEDNMCPTFLPLPSSPEGGAPSGKHLLTFISHNRGCQYYIGTYDKANDRFLPESHGRMSWTDNAYFAPEAMIDGRGRHLLWAWLLDNLNDAQARGWSGVYAWPRTLWLREDGTLGIAPAQEIERLRIRQLPVAADVSLAAGERRELPGVPLETCEIALEVKKGAGAFSLLLHESVDGSEKTEIRYDASARELAMSSQTPEGSFVERAPFVLASGETLSLRIFCDRPILEVFANGRQAISRRAWHTASATRVALVSHGEPVRLGKVAVWELDAANSY